MAIKGGQCAAGADNPWPWRVLREEEGKGLGKGKGQRKVSKGVQWATMG